MINNLLFDKLLINVGMNFNSKLGEEEGEEEGRDRRRPERAPTVCGVLHEEEQTLLL